MGMLSIALLLPLLLFLLVKEIDAKRQSFIVHTDPSAVGDSIAKAEIYQRMVKAAILSSVTGLQGTLNTTGSNQSTIFHVYDSVINGFAASLTSEEVTYLEALPEVIGVYPDRVMQVQTTHTPEYVGLSESHGIWPESKFGEDVIIGLLDTGVWPESLSFSDDSLGPIPARWKGTCVSGTRFTTANCNRKLIGARYYYKGYLAMYGLKQLNESDEIVSARDNIGHGTHTASTAAGGWASGASLFGLANGTARGMAPKARIAVYKVCWKIDCVHSDILAAYDQAIADGVDVISMSLGDPTAFEYFQDGSAIGAYAAVSRGIFVSASAGNSGPEPYTVVNVAPWFTTVGATTVDRDFAVNVVLGNGTSLQGVSLYNSGKRLGQRNLPLILGSHASLTNAKESTFCLPGSLNASLVKGKLVVCIRGGSTGINKGMVVQAAGGAGMIFANSPSDEDNIFAYLYVLPATMVSYRDGSIIESYAGSTPNPVAHLTVPATTALGVKPSPLVATFSSRGPNVQSPLLLKPDLVGPGVEILAAWSTELSVVIEDSTDPRRAKFNIISGTSMSCPHISGLGALLKSVHRDWSPAAIRSALMTTSTTIDNSNSLIADTTNHAVAATPYAYGSGFVQPERAVDPGLIYDLDPSDYSNFLCASGYSTKQIRLFDPTRNACPAKAMRIEDFNYPSFTAIFKPAESAAVGQGLTTTFRRTVTNVGPAARCSYTASISNVPAGYSVSVNPSTLTFKAKNEKVSFELSVSVPASPRPPVGTLDTKFSYLQWSDGVRVVKSPIAIAKQG